jgi:hypothetical protein
VGSKKKGGGGGQLQDSDLISVSITVGAAKALLAALSQLVPPSAAVGKTVSLALVRALSSSSGKKKQGKVLGKAPTSPTPPPKKTLSAAAP